MRLLARDSTARRIRRLTGDPGASIRTLAELGAAMLAAGIPIPSIVTSIRELVAAYG